jgi:hypothetical protein
MAYIRGLVTLAVLLGLGSLSPVLAQKTTLPESVYTSVGRSSVYTQQLRMASEFGRRALVALQNAPTDDSVPLDESVVQPARDTYVLIRAARHSMELQREMQKYPDPLLEIAFKRVDSAWNLSRTPVDKFSWGASLTRQQYLEVSVHDLTAALHLVDQVLILLP